jgi:hypothetical protein
MATPQPPATPGAILSAEKALGISFPDSLTSLLKQCNGVLNEHKSSLIWSAEAIANTNLEFRRNGDFAALYMAFDSLLFFGDVGNGDQYAFPVQAGQVRRPDIFVWDHETDSRSWFAPRLESFFEAVCRANGAP